MSLNFAAISPHPPIIIPEIGSDEDLEKCRVTVLGMKKLAAIFQGAEIDTLIIISPHGNIYSDRFSICSMKKLFGTFAAFNHPEIMIEGQNDLDLVSLLEKEFNQSKAPYLFFDNEGEFFELDHGTMVPAFYLQNNQEFPFRIVPVSYSNLNRSQHFDFGKSLFRAIQNYPGRVGVLASGDLSHQLFQNPEAKEFDAQLVEDLKNNQVQNILYYDEDLVEKIGECGFRSILILLGVLDEVDYKPEILSYEGPFGVGYLVANYKLTGNE